MTRQRQLAVLAALVGPAMLAACGGGSDSPPRVESHTVTVAASSGGSVSHTTLTVNAGEQAEITIIADEGHVLEHVSGCGGAYAGGSYTTGAVTAPCTVTVQFVPWVLNLSIGPIKTFSFDWPNVMGVTHYQLLENPDGSSGFGVVANPTQTSHDLIVPLHKRFQASYVVQPCVGEVCGATTAAANVTGSLVEAVGHLTAFNASLNDKFGWSVALSADGSTLAVGAEEQGELVADMSGAAYVFVQDGSDWSLQTYIDAPTGANVDFGRAVALSSDGDTLVVGAPYHYDEDATKRSGMVHVYTRTDGDWQSAALLQPLPDSNIEFGRSVALSADGTVLVGGARGGKAYVYELTGGEWVLGTVLEKWTASALDNFGVSLAVSQDGSTIVVGDNHDTHNTGLVSDGYIHTAGAAFVFKRGGDGWVKNVRLIASNAEASDEFGISVAVSADGGTVVVGAHKEDSGATGVNPANGAQADNSTTDSGAVYVFALSAGEAVQQAYIKASNAEATDQFGRAVALAADGKTLVVVAPNEDGSTLGLNGDQADNAQSTSGASYVFVLEDDGWRQLAYLKASVPSGHFSEGSTTAAAISADGDTIAVGEPGAALGKGAVFLY